MAQFRCPTIGIDSVCTHSLQLNTNRGKNVKRFKKLDYFLVAWVDDIDKIIDNLQDMDFTSMKKIGGNTIGIVDENPTEISRIIVMSLVCRFTYEQPCRRKYRIDYSTPKTFIKTAIKNSMLSGHMGSFGIEMCRRFFHLKEEQDALEEALTSERIYDTWRELSYDLKFRKTPSSNFYSYFHR